MEKYTPQDLAALRFIRNSLAHTGQAPSVRALMRAMGYQSPRSADILIRRLIELGYLLRKEDGSLTLLKEIGQEEDNARTVDIPLVGSVACGGPIYAEENVEAMIPVSERLVNSSEGYFILRAKGDSMDQAGIFDGDLLLVKQQPVARTGDRVVALIDDSATVKEYRPSDNTITLWPRSKNPAHQPIVLTEDFHIQGVVKYVIPQAKG